MSEVEERLERMGLVLPRCPVPVASYVVAMAAGELIYASGQTPVLEGKLLYTGKVGKSVTIEEAYECAKVCALRLIAELKELVGDLDQIKQIVKLNGYVNSEGDFSRQPQVMNGASDLLVAAFGERGKHARAAIGVSTLPDNAPVEVELIAMV